MPTLMTAQQIVGVNERLGNMAVPQMQGTTRMIYDTLQGSGTNPGSYTFFNNVSSRTYPLSNISQNRFEVGESLAVQYIAVGAYAAAAGAAFPALATATSLLNAVPNIGVLNLFIGNQRVLKNFEILEYSLNVTGQTKTNLTNAVVILETPIVIPPQIEFYATLDLNQNVAAGTRVVLMLGGLGTLLNPKETF